MSSDAPGDDEAAEAAEQHAPGHQKNPELKWQERQRRQSEGLGRDLAEPGAPDQEQDPEREEREQGAAPPCSTPSATKGPRT